MSAEVLHVILLDLVVTEKESYNVQVNDEVGEYLKNDKQDRIEK